MAMGWMVQDRPAARYVAALAAIIAVVLPGRRQAVRLGLAWRRRPAGPRRAGVGLAVPDPASAAAA